MAGGGLGVTELKVVTPFPHLPVDGSEIYFLAQNSRGKNEVASRLEPLSLKLLLRR